MVVQNGDESYGKSVKNHPNKISKLIWDSLFVCSEKCSRGVAGVPFLETVSFSLIRFDVLNNQFGDL